MDIYKMYVVVIMLTMWIIHWKYLILTMWINNLQKNMYM